MKDQLGADRQQNWSEEGKTGRLFILFVSLIMSSYVRQIWKSTKLKEKFSSSLDILDEMRSIRCVEYGNEMKITPFTGAQVDICEEFGFSILEGSCSLNSSSNQRPKGNRGRPPKNKLQEDSSLASPPDERPIRNRGRPPKNKLQEDSSLVSAAD
jgi:hypothetical protein